MAREKGEVFPSDHRRWFRVMEDILDNPKLEQCSADEFRFFLRLMALLNRTKARSGKIELTNAALRLCAGREQLRASVAVWRSGAEAGLWRISVEGARTLTEVPKWAELQQLSPTAPQRDPGETPATTPTPKTKTRVSVADAPDPPPVDPYRLPPDTPTLPDAHIQKLIATKPHGMVHSPHDVACWFAEKEPKMRASGKKSMTRTATAWWGRLKPGEVNASREWVRMVNARASGERLKAEEAARPPPPEYSREELEALADQFAPKQRG